MHFQGLDRLGLLGLASFGDASSFNLVRATSQITEGVCDSSKQFIFKNGTWRPLAVGDVCQGYANVTSGHDATTPGGGVTIGPAPDHGPIPVEYDFDLNEDASSTAPGADHQSIQVGPFKIPLGAREYTIHWQGLMPADWRAFIIPELEHDCSNCVFSSMTDSTEGHPLGTLRDFFGPDTPPKVNKDLVTISKLVNVPVPNGTVDPFTGQQTQFTQKLVVELPDQPIAVVTRPDNGEEWGMYMVMMPIDPTYPWDSTGNPYVLNFFWRKRPAGVWDWIKRIVGFIINESIAIGCQMMPITDKIQNPYTQGTNIVLKLSGQCPQTCPVGMIYNDAAKTCSCQPGFTYDPATKACVQMPAATGGKVPWFVAGALALIGLAVAVKVSREKRTPAHREHREVPPAP
jgi:hypothetical protein